MLDALAALELDEHPERETDEIARLGQYVQRAKATWDDADAAERLLLLLRTLVKAMWVDGGRIVAIQPVPAFAPFFRSQEEDEAPGPSGALGAGPGPLRVGLTQAHPKGHKMQRRSPANWRAA